MSSSKLSNSPDRVKDQSPRKRKEKRDKKKIQKRKLHKETEDKSATRNEKIARKEASKMANNDNDKTSAFQEKRVRVLVSLPPASLVNIPNALNTSMQNLLLKYSNGLGGVLIAYHDIELDRSKRDGTHGKIINEMPHIHYYINCNVLIFNPDIGVQLKGRVNESFPSHVGLLVHDMFNAMISAEYLRQNGFNFDDESNEWKMEDEIDEGRKIRVGEGMKFIIEKFHECNGLISLEGKDPQFLDLA